MLTLFFISSLLFTRVSFFLSLSLGPSLFHTHAHTHTHTHIHALVAVLLRPLPLSAREGTECETDPRLDRRGGLLLFLSPSLHRHSQRSPSASYQCSLRRPLLGSSQGQSERGGRCPAVSTPLFLLHSLPLVCDTCKGRLLRKILHTHRHTYTASSCIPFPLLLTRQSRSSHWISLTFSSLCAPLPPPDLLYSLAVA